MKIFERFDVKRFLLRFGSGIDTDAYKIVEYKPLSNGPISGNAYSPTANKYKNLLILYNEFDTKNTKEFAEKLKKHLIEGLENKRIFPGFNNLFDLNIEISSVPFKGYESQEIYEAFEQHCGNIDTSFPLVILPRVSRGIYDSIYYTTKATFLAKEIPSQIFTLDVLTDDATYKWSLLPAAVQIFVKMGGVPYILDRSVISEKISEDTAVFIMGLGISYHPLYKRRGVGFITIFDHRGTWYFMDSTSLIIGEKEDISKKLADLLKRAIHQMLTVSEFQKNVLIIHYSGKEVGYVEEEAIRSAIEKLKSELGKFISVYILKIKDSDIIIGYSRSPYTVNNVETGYPPIGITFQLKPGLYLMVTSGYFITITGTGVKVRGNIRRGLPTAKIVSRHVEMEPVEDKIKLDDKQLLATVFGMCRLNYNSIQNPISRDPITIRYSREIAWLSLRLLELGVDIDKIARIKRIMWFI